TTLAYGKKGEKQQTLRVIDTHAAQVLVKQVGHQVKPAHQLAKLALEADVDGVIGHFVGQQQRLALRVTTRVQQPGGYFHITRGIVNTARVQGVGNVEAAFIVMGRQNHVS